MDNATEGLDAVKLLDLFCGAGGSAAGYAMAGFTEIVGIDNRPQPRYPFTFVLADALEYLAWLIESGEVEEYDLIHSSPPCQGYSWCTPKGHREKHPDLISATRELLIKSGRPYVIENVGGARSKLLSPVKLCGSMFGLLTRRHRYFEVHPLHLTLTPPCRHDVAPLLVTTAGSNSRAIRAEGQYKSVHNAPLAYGIDWMTADELKEAIPPAYTRYIGEQMARQVLR